MRCTARYTGCAESPAANREIRHRSNVRRGSAGASMQRRGGRRITSTRAGEGSGFVGHRTCVQTTSRLREGLLHDVEARGEEIRP